MKYTHKLLLASVLPLLLILTSCTQFQGEEPIENSERYIQAPIQEYIDEWMTFRNGTITASGNNTYYYDVAETSAVDTASTDMRYDLPGTHCYLTEDDNESAYATLNVATSPRETGPVDLDQELEKVSEYWRSQGITEIHSGPETKSEKRIIAVTPLGTRMIYAVRYRNGLMTQTFRMDSLCAKEFGWNSPSYLGDFNDRFNTTPTPTPSQE